MKEIIGLISGLIVVLSSIPYGIRTYQRKVKPNLASWSIWAFIGLALLLTYKSSGATDNIWPAIFGFTNPLIIAILAIWRGDRKKLSQLEIACVIFAFVSIGLWYFVRGNPSTAQWSLYIAIVADLFAAIPTAVFFWKNPEGDRPIPWGSFALGYGLAVFAISDHTFANYILPIYMFVGSALLTSFLVPYRIRNRIPIKEWI